MKQRIKYALKTGLFRGVSLCLLAFLTIAAVLYQKGYYDFTFIERPIPDTGDNEQTASSTDEEEWSSSVGTTYGTGDDTVNTAEQTDTAGVQQNPGTISDQKPNRPTARRYVNGKQSCEALAKIGYTAQTGGTFSGKTWVLAERKISGLPQGYSSSKYQARALTVTEYERGCVVTEETVKEADRPALMLKNGYIICDRGGGKLSLLYRDGRTLLSDYQEAEFYLTDYRDENGNALFAAPRTEKQMVRQPILEKNEFTGRLEESGLYEDEVETDVIVNTYYTLSSDGKWVKRDDIDESWIAEYENGIVFDAPSDYGMSDCDLERYRNGSRWGYRSKSTGQVVIYPSYTMAYDYHDGYAVCFDDYMMHILDITGKEVYAVGFDRPEVFATFNEVTIPDTNGIEILGTYYVSHGLTRVRFRRNLVTYQVYYYIKSDDYAALIDITGKEFPIPAGYQLESYSDGVLLLKKEDEGLYGYMNYKGEWIAQPQYTYARPFLMGLGVIGDENGKKGVIDTDGTLIVPQVFDYISDVSSGTLAMYDRTVGWKIYQCMEKQ